MRQIEYIKGMKYQLRRDYVTQIPIYGEEFEHRYFSLAKDGTLTIRKSYAWNGADFPGIDTKSAMRGSLEHDALCQALRLGLLDMKYQRIVHEQLEKTCIEDGMWQWRANLWRNAVIAANGGDVGKGPDRPSHFAP